MRCGEPKLAVWVGLARTSAAFDAIRYQIVQSMLRFVSTHHKSSNGNTLVRNDPFRQIVKKFTNSLASLSGGD